MKKIRVTRENQELLNKHNFMNSDFERIRLWRSNCRRNSNVTQWSKTKIEKREYRNFFISSKCDYRIKIKILEEYYEIIRLFKN